MSEVISSNMLKGMAAIADRRCHCALKRRYKKRDLIQVRDIL